MRLWWNDPRLVWNTSDYGGENQIVLPFKDLWTPDVTIFDSASETMMPGRREYRPIVLNNGTVIYLFPTIVDSICVIDVLYFPMDTQECRLMFGSWSHSGKEIDFFPKIPTGDMDFFITNNEWTVLSFNARRNVAYYKCCPDPFPDVTFYLRIRRKPLFYILSVLFPCILTSSVAILAFLLPPDSGEKVSLNVTVLLSLAVFLLMVSDQLPASSDHFPYVGMYFACSMFLVSLSLLMTVCVLNMHFRAPGDGKAPSWMHPVFLHFGRRFLLCQSENKVQPCKQRQLSNIRLQNIGRYSEDQNFRSPMYNISTIGLEDDARKSYISLNFTNSHKDLAQTENSSVCDEPGLSEGRLNEWQEIAMVMDRLFLILFILITLITSVVFLGLMGNE
ncbi:neuronal acetylcholine receptor subunit alpha-7-like [Saccostrea cucullata]|uniref:neuronal acetylcholine receptor subunit alpha-7-like n=1 Tax=Saccostrea cuccullata TaxID=36930 RepID=UPI002ED27BB2